MILVVGDGMSLTTATAARILRGQRRGQSGEDTDLVWDTFPAVALAKVCLNLYYRITCDPLKFLTVYFLSVLILKKILPMSFDATNRYC